MIHGLTDKELAAIRTRHDASTCGRWEWYDAFDAVHKDAFLGYIPMVSRRLGTNKETVLTGCCSEQNTDILGRKEDLQFIAYAHEDIPSLLKTIENLQHGLATMTRAHLGALPKQSRIDKIVREFQIRDHSDGNRKSADS